MIRVMVVDDHEFVRTAMCELLDATDDMRVVGEVENGTEAVPAARDTDPDVVLIDLSMPVMNGIDATRELVGALPEVQVIVLTISTRGQDVPTPPPVQLASSARAPTQRPCWTRSAPQSTAARRGTGGRRKSYAEWRRALHPVRLWSLSAARRARSTIRRSSAGFQPST